MSMTYYAVTDDPNELVHWGVKGMKWGVRHDKPRHTGSQRPRSAAYKKAQSKLGKMMKSGIKKAEASWRVYNSPEAKYERQTNRAIQLARKGKLKYGKLTDDQVRRVTQRLDLERQARQLSSTEQTFRHRLGKSITEGIISGVGSGVGNIVSEKISRGSKLKTDRMRSEQQDEFDRIKEERRIRNARKEARHKIVRDNVEQRIKDNYEHNRDDRYEEDKGKKIHLYGVTYDDKGNLTAEGYKKLYEGRRIIPKQNKEKERQRRIEEKAFNRELAAEQRSRDAELERQRQAARQKELERYRSGMAKLSAEASKRDADRAWESKQSRIRESQEKERYRKNVHNLYGESSSKLRFGAYDDSPQISYTTASKRKRSRRGRVK